MRTELKEIEQQRDILLKFRSDKTELNSIYEKMNTYLPKDVNGGDFVTQLEALAGQTNQNQTEISLKIKKTKTAEDETAAAKKNTAAAPVSSGAIKENDFSLSQTGNFPDLLKFVQGMEIMSRLNTFKNLSLILSTDNVLTTKIDGVIYYKAEITIEDVLANLTITDKDKEKVNDLEHFGEIITSSQTSGRSDPFAVQ